MTAGTQLETEVLEAAATWYVDLRNAGPNDPLRVAHTQWLSAHPAHQRAWQRMQQLQQMLERAPERIARPVLSTTGRSRRRAIRTLTGLLVIAGASRVAWQQRDVAQALVADLRTGTGERLDHRLADGGLLQLNTGTAVDIRYGETLRELLLHRGEVLIETAVDRQYRPFVVHARNGSIRALGTRFTVRSDGVGCCVGVLEGAVDIRPNTSHGASSPPQRVEAGQQLVFGGDHRGAPVPLEANASAWVDGLLVASDWRLDRFAAELSRYHAGRIVCDDAVAALRISGAFHVRDLNVVLENVGSTLPIRARHFTRYWIRLEAA